MSGSSPSDLAVAFRSIERRLREALEPVNGDRSVAAGKIRGLERSVADAASLLGIRGGATEVAAAIDARPADSWGTDLDVLRATALDIGRALREIGESAEAAAD